MVNKKPTPRRSIGFRRTSISTTTDQSTKPFLNELRRRDTMEVRDSEYQLNCINTLTNFLIEHQYPITNKTLHNPSSKDFQEIFICIIKKIDDIKFDRFEEEAFNFLKCLKYPFINELNRSSMKTVTPHMWPVLLSMLSWLVETVNGAKIEENINNEINIKTYLKYLDGEDEEMNNLIENYKEDILKNIGNEIKELKIKENELKNEIKGINITDNNLIKKELNELEELNEELKKNIKKIPIKIKKINEEKEELIKEYLETEDKIKEIKKYNEKLNNKIKNQEINIEEYKRLKKELIELENQTENLTKIKKEIYKNNEESSEKLKLIYKNNEDILDKIQNFRKIKIDLKKRNFKEIFEDTERIKDEKNQDMILMNSEVEFLIKMEKNKTEEIDRLNQLIEIENKEFSQIASNFLDKKHTDEINQACCMKDIDKMKNKFYKSSDIERLSLFRLTNELEKEKINHQSKINEFDQIHEEQTKRIKFNIEIFEELVEIFETQEAEIDLFFTEII